jgi:hypothetical protein
MLALSATVSAFVLVLVGAAASLAVRSRQPSAADAAPVAQEVRSVPFEVVRAREAEYRRLIEEANARLRATAEAVPLPDSSPRPASGYAGGHERDDDKGERSTPRLARHRSDHEDDDG